MQNNQSGFRARRTSVTLLFIFVFGALYAQSSWIRVNQVGYLEDDVKVAVWVSKQNYTITEFNVINTGTGECSFTGSGSDIRHTGKQPAFKSSARLDFTAVGIPGTYIVKVGEIESPPFRVGNEVYAGAAEIPLKYMRQQRCGYNPFLKDSCHVHDAISVGDPDGKRDGLYFNTVGGWHDASDYLQYVATSANAVYQMFFAYSRYPESFGDNYDANGDEGANGIPDILDEAKWGLDWLVKMNPDADTYFNQLADDMQLAAAEMYNAFGQKEYLAQAINYGRLEPVTPWMGADSARHYQWYPFVNLGHYHIAVQQNDLRAQKEFIRNMKSGLQRVKERAEGDAFLNGIPFIWCSNNLAVGFITQCRLYHDITGDNSFLEIEAAMRDWLLGCNPWGTSMIVGYPEQGDTPEDPHSAFTHLHQIPVTGGIVDGPIYHSIFSNLIGIYLANEDKYAGFQSDYVVYHDDYADYSTNEPTMDGTASLTYYLGYLSAQAKGLERVAGGIIRGDPSKKQLSLIFTGHEYADGARTIQKVLKKNNVKGTFFLTGDFYRKYPGIVRDLQKDGHYLGPHSDKHLLYADWQKRDSLLISRSDFEKDLNDNYQTIKEIGLKVESPRYFMPPYEWYNRQISDWAKSMGVQIVNFTPGTTSNADYTTPDMKNYLSSETICHNILQYEEKNGLNGFLLLMHIGTDPKRTDKLYNRLENLIRELKNRGYELKSISEML